MKKIKPFLPFILLGIVVLFSLGNTLRYYFYTDDYAFLYYLGSNYEFGWPYSSVLPLFRPVYNLFGINALPYFSLALFTYLLASISVYFFAKKLTSNKLIALLSSLIFATGYVGLDQFTMIAVSIINNLNVINVCITLILLIKWIETKKLRYYFLTFFMFWFSMWLFPYRAYPLILFLPTLELIKSFQLGSVIKMAKQFIFLVVRYIPFVLVASRHGVFSYGTHGTENIDLFYLLTTNNKIFTLLTFEYLREIFAILGRLILVKPVSDIFSFVPDQSVFALTGFIFFLIMLVTSLFFFFGKNSGYARSLLAVLLLTIEGYVGNMFLNVDFDANGPINRYLTISFMSFSVIIPLFLFIILTIIDKFEKFKWLNKKWILVSLSILVVLSFASLSRKYENFIIEERSLPSKNFYMQLKAYIPKLSDSSYNIFYFDRALYHPVSSRFGSVLASAALGNSVNLAVPYKVSIDSIKIVDTFEEFLLLISRPPLGKKVSYYTFYNDEKGLHNTTEKVFALLKNGSNVIIPKDQIKYTKSKSGSLISIQTNGISSLTPIRVIINLRAAPEPTASFSFPYLGTQDESVRNYYEENKIQKDKIYKYLLSREKYYKTVKVDVESIHIAKQNPASYLVDDKLDTSWISDQSRWEVQIKPWIKLHLGEERSISKLLWRQLPSRVITGFTIETSNDGINWIKINNVHKSNLSSDINLVVNDFPEVNARYVMLTINSLLGPGPGLAEIEAVENEFRNIDLTAALRIKDNPFEYIKDNLELEETYSYLSENAKLKIKSVTNRNDPNSNAVLKELPIAMDGVRHEYEFQLPPGGTQLKNIKLEANFPANFSIDSVLLENLPQNVLDQQIKQKCQDFAQEKDYASPFNCK